ncbi:hypothetical protein [Simiduia agarivorans]|uniref:Uncharacterized protein n=1 Tax=Simiduia agarivorans (strain DSM 21679 / JCM 13881 / BCRC 17597 / SA1) TaxID=1117647 RepID=K4KN37_SIMAS|nr:hypothetical protein [Simiduia agarivorans]AFU99518.1 hypothetical protein M5M_11705 [Simiduia agarivorans SA1 = DSM 21679]
MKHITLALLLFLACMDTYPCGKDAPVGQIQIDFRKNQNGVSGYELLVAKSLDGQQLVKLEVRSVVQESVVFNIATEFHDASLYEEDEIYETHVRSWFVLADSLIESIVIVASYSQISESGAVLMCAPAYRVGLNELIERYNEGLQQSEEARADSGKL